MLGPPIRVLNEAMRRERNRRRPRRGVAPEGRDRKRRSRPQSSAHSDPGGAGRVSGNIVFWPDDLEKAKTYLNALAGPWWGDVSDEMVEVRAREMRANRASLESLGLEPATFGLAEFPEPPGSDCGEERGEEKPANAR